MTISFTCGLVESTTTIYEGFSDWSSDRSYESSLVRPYVEIDFGDVVFDLRLQVMSMSRLQASTCYALRHIPDD